MWRSEDGDGGWWSPGENALLSVMVGVSEGEGALCQSMRN